MKKTDYFKQYMSIVAERKELIQSYEYLTSKLATIPGQVLTDMPRASHSKNDKIGGSIVQLEKLEKILEKNLKKLLHIRIEIENMIANLENSTHRRLMRLRYIEGLNWEAVAIKMCYSYPQMFRIHGYALELIEYYDYLV